MTNIIWQDVGKGHVTIDGLALEFCTYGPAPDAAPTLVMLHEGLGCVALWRDVPTQLAAATGCGVFVYSRAGYGHSEAGSLPWRLDYMTRHAEQVLPVLLNALAPKSLILLGHSDGATISAMYAGSHEDNRLQGVILLAPHFFTEDFGLAAIAEAKQAFETGDLRDRMAKYHKNPDHCFRGWNDAWLHPDFREWNVADCLDYIRVPVLAIQGHDDQYGSMAQLDEIAERCYSPVEQLRLDACRHAPHLDHPEKTTAAIAAFTDRIAAINAID